MRRIEASLPKGRNGRSRSRRHRDDFSHERREGTASGIILNTARCLESSSLSWLQQKLGIPVYPLGPLHITASTNSSLLEEDMSCIEWLNKQKSRSVIYISLGSKGSYGDDVGVV
ncbi:hypothetical protein DY000_02058997 [Brassica cretica]|uniref:Uncharacterized protein n=1 Tax=Brassica cretica TaxID=69181 RepID=A0ABQ7B407_BRACR|nr:hypothetical protein DY000_02058997 [Brassica cretica]